MLEVLEIDVQEPEMLFELRFPGLLPARAPFPGGEPRIEVRAILVESLIAAV